MLAQASTQFLRSSEFRCRSLNVVGLLQIHMVSTFQNISALTVSVQLHRHSVSYQLMFRSDSIAQIPGKLEETRTKVQVHSTGDNPSVIHCGYPRLRRTDRGTHRHPRPRPRAPECVLSCSRNTETRHHSPTLHERKRGTKCAPARGRPSHSPRPFPESQLH